MEAFMYTEVLVICMLLNSILLYKAYHQKNTLKSHKLYIRALICGLLMMTADLIWGLMHYEILPRTESISLILNQTYYLLIVFLLYFWFAYTECVQQSPYQSSRRYRILTFLPVVAIFCFVISSPLTRWVFYIDDQGTYHRGSLYYWFQVIAFLYLVSASLKLIINAFKKSNYVHRREYLILSSFIVLPLISALLQIFFFGVPILCVGITLGILMVYMNSQELQISRDHLTQINNRHQMLHYLSAKINHLTPDKNLYFLLMDINNFKSINDTYGHLEGDQALIYLARTLTALCNEYNCFSARYGGDEFVVICEVSSINELNSLCAFIHENLKKHTESSTLPYELSVTIGCAKYTKSINYIQDLISIADKQLYQAKSKRRPSVK